MVLIQFVANPGDNGFQERNAEADNHRGKSHRHHVLFHGCGLPVQIFHVTLAVVTTTQWVLVGAVQVLNQMHDSEDQVNEEVEEAHNAPEDDPSLLHWRFAPWYKIAQTNHNQHAESAKEIKHNTLRNEQRQKQEPKANHPLPHGQCPLCRWFTGIAHPHRKQHLDVTGQPRKPLILSPGCF